MNFNDDHRPVSGEGGAPKQPPPPPPPHHHQQQQHHHHQHHHHQEPHHHEHQLIRREIDSLDDFEHLGHDDDSSPLRECPASSAAHITINTSTTSNFNDNSTTTATDITISPIKTRSHHLIDDNLSQFDPLTIDPIKMDTNLYQMGGDHFPDRKEADDKLDKFLQEMASFAPPPPTTATITKLQESPVKEFLEKERGNKKSAEQLEKYSDSEPEDEEEDEDDDFKPSKYEDFPKKAELPESFGSNENFKAETFKDFEEHHEKEIKPAPVASAPLIEPKEVPIMKQRTPSPPPPVKETPKPPVELPKEAPKKPDVIETVSTKKPTVIDAEAIFCKMGLDTWFNPERLNPKVESLIYWRDPKKSGPVFGGVLLILLALTYFSFISVIAYLSLLGLTVTISFRIYKNIVQAVQKTGEGHPFKEYLEYDVSLPQDKVKEVLEVAVAHLNAAVVELRRLFLVEDLVDSIKFGVLLWTLTYLGAWFNGMTLIIIGWVALFSLPKVYEANKTQIDANLEIVRTKLAEITSKVKAAIPIGKKAVEAEKKEQ